MFGIAESAGGEISTEGMKSQNIIPLVKDGSILNAVSGNVVFLPFPEKMLTEDGQEVSYSVDQSGQGWAAYIDTSGNLLRKMITRIPNAATIDAGVSFNSSDRGTVYAVKLSESGEVQGKARLVFDAQTTLSVVFEAGEVAIDVNNQPVAPDYQTGNWEVDSLQKLYSRLNAAGLIFPPETTTRITQEHYGFVFSLSTGILKNSGLKYIHIPDDVADKMFLQTMGRFMYFLRDFYPERYSEFYDLAEKINNGTINVYGAEYTLHSELAQKEYGEGPIPIKFNNSDISGLITGLEVNLVSKQEFTDIVIPVLDRNAIVYSAKAPWIHENFSGDSDFAAFISRERLIIFAYSHGTSGDREGPHPESIPLELQKSKDRMILLTNVLNLWYRTVVLTQINFAGHDYGTNSISRYDLSTLMVYPVQQFVCGPRESERIAWENHCKELLNQTFIPNNTTP